MDIKARLKEPSSWAGISAALAATGPQLPPSISPYVYLGSAFAAIAAVLVGEGK